MDNISEILREAKPLYFKRKYQRNQIKAFLAVVVCAWGLSCFVNTPSAYNYNLDNLDSEIAQVAEGSVIEEMGLPTDEFGLLMVV